MDVIASGIEACPWGLNGYGFEPYISSTPGNAVWALARFWVDSVTATLATEEQFAASCLRVRYEDLVADPETMAAGIFEFLGVPQEPGISRRCFSSERERFGPADYKIWHTTRISDKSVGRGWSVPAAMIPLPVVQTMNELTEKLGYLPVDEAWGTAALPADLRTGHTRADDAPAETPGSAVVGDRLRVGLARIDSEFIQRWKSFSEESFAVVTMPPSAAGGGRGNRWRVDLASRTVTSGDDGADTAWDIVGSIDAWHAVLGGDTNLGVAMRRCELRYCQTEEAGPVAADLRIGMLTDLLGLG
jgi:hypothetical protein